MLTPWENEQKPQSVKIKTKRRTKRAIRDQMFQPWSTDAGGSL